ncbi:MAG TPA: DUF6391 domain-containing protein, partial [Dehalococcoidia bacterium]|nr:DUF6391 domain-containing protein [Dehalococcoidia bacterium]
MSSPKRMFGRATHDGFYLYADVSEEQFTEAVHEALGRMKSGEANLAVSPLCGTNIVMAGVMTAIVSLFTVGQKTRLERFPNIITATTMGVIAGQPVGRLLQKHVTTSGQVDGVEIVSISRGRTIGKPYKVKLSKTGAAAG